MKVVVQNLQKRSKLASKLVEAYQPDVLLAQEIHLSSESTEFRQHTASFVSKRGYGTAVYATKPLNHVHQVESPHPEVGGWIVKKTTVATTTDSHIQLVSFHGYNGQPRPKLQYLLDHVTTVLQVLSPDQAALFAGDFNTWTPAHVDGVATLLSEHGLVLACSWPYPERTVPLDHVFVRGLQVTSWSTFQNESDHLGVVLDVDVVPD